MSSAASSALSQLNNVNIIHQIEAKLGVPRIVSVAVIFIAISLIVFHGYGVKIINTVFGFVFPLLESIRAIDRKNDDEIRSWTVYWLVFSAVSALESFVDSVMWWAPLYYPLKLAFLLWCYLPQCRGSLLIYECLLAPLLARHAPLIEDSIGSISEAAAVTAKHVVAKTRKASVNLFGKSAVIPPSS